MKYRSTKTYGHDLGLTTCFRQWRAESHCRFLHGYALSFKFTFEAEKLDSKNWVIDFGELKSLKQTLVDNFDHTMLIASDDPISKRLNELALEMGQRAIEVPATGCEAIAQICFEFADMWLHDNGHSKRVWIKSVEVAEHGANSALYLREDRDLDELIKWKNRVNDQLI